jgi:hypothetical protein
MTAPDPVDVPPAPRSQVLCAAWASPADVPETRRQLLSNEEWEAVLMQASEILWMLSGRRFYGGGCEEVVTLRSNPPGAGQGSWPYHQSWGTCACWSLAEWHNGWLRPVGDYAGRHYSAMAIKLPRSPAVVTEVTHNGEAFTAWRLTRSGYLERTDGSSWNLCDDSTSVVYTFGEPPGEAGVQAAVELAIQMVLYQRGDGECQLPQRLQSVTRQGISMAVLDPQEFLADGRTGMYMIDLFLAAVNPKSRGQRARVWSPDIPTAIRQ